MITIIISGPQGIGTSRIARVFKSALVKYGFISFKIFTTNTPIAISDDMNEED